MLNARKRICGEFVSKAQLKRGFVWFSKLPRMFAAEIVLEAYIASWKPGNHKLQLEMRSVTLEPGKSQSPHCAHLHLPVPVWGVPADWHTSPACLCSGCMCIQATHYPNLKVWHFHCIRKSNSMVGRGMYLFSAYSGVDKQQAYSRHVCMLEGQTATYSKWMNWIQRD